MRFLTFERDGEPCLGTLADGEVVVDLPRGWDECRRRQLAALPGGRTGPFPQDMQALIREADWAVAAAKAVAAAVLEARVREAVLPLAGCRLLAPIPRPAKNVFCVGRNYMDHVAEGDRSRGVETSIPPHPQFFTKPPTAVIGPEDPIRWDPAVTAMLDYEAELAVVIGRAGRNIRREEAYGYVFGYTVLNDVTGRDLQRRHGQWFKGKALDASCPMGPYLVHKDAIPDPQALAIRLSVNGEVRQDANTRDMIFDIPTLIEVLSAGMTLEPGDIIATGTPGGVGYARKPPQFLGAGDRVEVEVEGLGVLRNRVEKVSGR